MTFIKYVFAAWRMCLQGERLECESWNQIKEIKTDCKHLYLESVYWMERESVCAWWHQMIWFYVEPGHQWLVKTITYLVPIWAFFILDKPHDCFRCLGKDPDRIFSIDQYRKDEIVALKMRNKYG